MSITCANTIAPIPTTTRPPVPPRRQHGDVELFRRHDATDELHEYQTRINRETLHGLFQGVAGLARRLEQVPNQVLDARLSEHLGAERYERIEERLGYRNGVRPRTASQQAHRRDARRAEGARRTRPNRRQRRHALEKRWRSA